MTLQTNYYVDEMNSPIGKLTIVATERGVYCLKFGDLQQNIEGIHASLRKNGFQGELIYSQEKLAPVCTQINEYFNKRRLTFDLPLDLYGTPFQKKVWNELQKIAYGNTCSYKDIAIKIGVPKAVRAIGGANNKNPIPIIIPCHRVIGSNGKLVGYGGGMRVKETLLQLEDAIEQTS